MHSGRNYRILVAISLHLAKPGKDQPTKSREVTPKKLSYLSYKIGFISISENQNFMTQSLPKYVVIMTSKKLQIVGSMKIENCNIWVFLLNRTKIQLILENYLVYISSKFSQSILRSFT